MACRRRPQGGRRGRRPRRVLLRRLPALRGDREVRTRHGRSGRRGRSWHAGAGHLQRLPGALRGRPAARRADPQRRPALRLPRRLAQGRLDHHGLDLPLRVGRRASGAAEVGRRPLRRQRRRARRTRRGGARGVPLRRQPQRLDARHRRHQLGRRPRRGSDAAPRARDRTAHRAVRRRSRDCSTPRWTPFSFRRSRAERRVPVASDRRTCRGNRTRRSARAQGVSATDASAV